MARHSTHNKIYDELERTNQWHPKGDIIHKPILKVPTWSAKPKKWGQQKASTQHNPNQHKTLTWMCNLKTTHLRGQLPHSNFLWPPIAPNLPSRSGIPTRAFSWKHSTNSPIPKSKGRRHLGEPKHQEEEGWWLYRHFHIRLVHGNTLKAGVRYGPWSWTKAGSWLVAEVVSRQLRFTLRKKWQRDHGGRGPYNIICKA